MNRAGRREPFRLKTVKARSAETRQRQAVGTTAGFYRRWEA